MRVVAKLTILSAHPRDVKPLVPVARLGASYDCPALIVAVRYASSGALVPVTSKDFRRIALSFPEAVESAHQDHPDFRVGGKVFATLGYPEKGWGMVKLPPKEQVFVIEAEPNVFQPAKGAWGLRGSTMVRLGSANKTSLRRALAAAWRNTAPKRLAAQFDKI